MFIIGLTGPSGAGKTTALRVLEELGGQVYDCDAVYHEMLASDRELLGQIEASFPGSVQDGTLDRKALGARVFADPAGLQRLTEITQPLVKRRVLERIRATETPRPCHSKPCPERGRRGSEESVLPGEGVRIAAASERTGLAMTYPAACASGGRPMAAPTSFAVIDAIGLFESGLGAECDLTVAVVADEEVRVRRLMERDGITEAYARARIAAQKPAAWFAQRADLVLENNGSEAEFAERCRRAFTQRCLMREDDPGAPQALRKGELMQDYSFIDLAKRPELEQKAAAWFHDKWGVPEEAYLECMDAYLAGETALGWYLCLETAPAASDGDRDGGQGSGRPTQSPERIVGGLGVIENDFHDRKDLSPNVCAVFTEPAHRGRGIAGRLLNMAVEALRAKGISPVYLVTDHTGFYERYGWECFCHAQGDGEDQPTRLYIHR